MNLRRWGLCLICCILLTPDPALALTLKGVTFAEQVQADNTPLKLHNAALLRYLLVIKAYVAALYLPEGIGAEQVLDNIPKRLEISYLVAIKGSDFGKGAQPVLERNQSPQQLAQLRSRIDLINAAYLDVEPGDRYSLTYRPGTGTELALNGTPLITIEGEDFAAAYFGIWLGREPIDEKLKRELLEGR